MSSVKKLLLATLATLILGIFFLLSLIREIIYSTKREPLQRCRDPLTQ